jgi:hypothetical protein
MLFFHLFCMTCYLSEFFTKPLTLKSPLFLINFTINYHTILLIIKLLYSLKKLTAYIFRFTLIFIEKN